MPSFRNRTGLSAEIAAAAELGRLGYRIVASNYRCRRGEIDLVAFDGDTLVFIEVRSKRTDRYGTPAESVTRSKQEKLVATAEHYLDTHGIKDVQCRFDVVEVTPVAGKLAVKNVIRDAFTA